MRPSARLVLGWASLLGLACSREPARTHLASGVVTELLVAGQGSVRPTPNDCVRVRYTSHRKDGTLQASNERDAVPTTQCLARTMPGLSEALQLMVAGEARRIWVPGRLTFRSREPGQPAPEDDLELEVHLLEVLKAPAVPSDLATPPASARRTPTGLVLQVLVPGRGPRQSQPSERLQVRFTGWTRKGEVYESTELSGQPASLTRADVVPGVGEGLSLMEVGEKARLWVPAALAFGDAPRRGLPAGDLTYDVELLAVQ